jgi:hypothetical protein
LAGMKQDDIFVILNEGTSTEKRIKGTLECLTGGKDIGYQFVFNQAVPWTTITIGAMRVYVGDYYAMKIHEIKNMKGCSLDYEKEIGNCTILYVHINDEARLYAVNKNKTCIDLLGIPDQNFGFNQHAYPVSNFKIDKDKGMVTFIQYYKDSLGRYKKIQYRYDVSRNVLFYRFDSK